MCQQFLALPPLSDLCQLVETALLDFPQDGDRELDSGNDSGPSTVRSCLAAWTGELGASHREIDPPSLETNALFVTSSPQIEENVSR